MTLLLAFSPVASAQDDSNSDSQPTVSSSDDSSGGIWQTIVDTAGQIADDIGSAIDFIIDSIWPDSDDDVFDYIDPIYPAPGPDDPDPDQPLPFPCPDSQDPWLREL